MVDRQQRPARRSTSSGWALRTRLAWLVGLTVLPLAAFVAWDLDRQRQEALDAAHADAAWRAHQVSTTYRQVFERAQDLAALVASLPSVRRADWPEVNRTLANFAHRFPEFPNIRVSNAAGEMQASALPGAPATSNSGRDWFEAVLRTGDYAISAPFVGVTTGRLVTVLGFPIKRHRDPPTGVVSVTIDVARLGALGTETAPPGFTVTVFGPQGRLLSQVPETRGAEVLGVVASPALVKQLWSGEPNGVLDTTLLDGVPRVAAYEHIPLAAQGPPVAVVVSRPHHQVMAPVIERITVVAMGGVLLVTLVSVAGGIGARTLIAEPVKALLDVQRRIASGDLAARAPDSLLRDGSEFGHLARALAALSDRLQERDADQAAAEARLRAILDGYPGFAALVSSDLRIVEVNAALLTGFRVARADVVGQTLTTPGHAGAPSSLRGLARVHDALGGQGGRETLEASLPGSVPRLIDATFTPVAGPDGVVGHVAVFGSDVTEALATERALEASRLELAGIFEGAPIALAYVTLMPDGGFRLASVNPALRRLFTMPELPADGLCFSVLEPAVFRESLLTHLREAVQRRAVVTWDQPLERRGGIRRLHLSLSPLVDTDGACTRLIGSVTDVTAEYNVAEAEREYASRMALIFNTSSDMQMLHRTDEHFSIEAVNQAFLAAARRRFPSDVNPVGKRRDDYLLAIGFSADAVARSQAKLRQAVDSRTRLNYPVEVQLPDALGGPQSYRLEVTVSPHVAPDGTCGYVLWSAYDVTARWRAEQSLRDSEARLLEAQRLAHVGSWEVDLRADRRHWSSEVYRILEIEEGDGPPSRPQFLDRVHPDDRDRIEAVFAAAVRDHTRYSVTHRLCLPDGRIKFVEQQAEIHYAADGTPLLARGTMHDLTERVLAAEALEASAASLRQAELLAGFGHYQADENGNGPECSEGFKRLFGFDAGARPSREDLGNRMHPADRAACGQSFEVARASGQPFDCTFRVRTPDGHARILHSRGGFRPDPVEGRLRFFAATVDVTDIKEAERRLAELNETLEQRVAQRTRDLESSNRELESFSYSVSHDLRAPLRAIEGFTHAVAESERARLSPEGLALLRRVQAAAQRMGRLIDALLGLSQMLREPLVTVPVDVTALARSIVDELRHADPASRPEVTIAEGLATVGDPRQLRVAFTNLIENAFKFSARAARPVVEVGVEALCGREVFFVRDNGVGFDMAKVGKLFQPFERLHSSLDYPGTGIGLATVMRIAQRHGGSAWAESAPGHGATFFFALDMVAPDRTAAP